MTSTSAPATSVLETLKSVISQQLSHLAEADRMLLSNEIVGVLGPVPVGLSLDAAIKIFDGLSPGPGKNLGFEKFARLLGALGEPQSLPFAARLEESTAAQEAANVKLEIKGIWGLYEKGQYVDGLDAAHKILTDRQETLPREARQEIYAYIAWCYYRRSEWDKALENIALADGFPRALECELYLRSYAEGYKDPVRVKELNAQIGQTLNGANAFIIRARTEAVTPYEEVIKLAESFSQYAVSHPHDVNYANLLHNTARVFLDKHRDKNDFLLAEQYFTRCLTAYGEEDKNVHAKAAATFWISTLYEKQGDLPKAAQMALVSEQLWLKQLSLQTQNPVHVDKYRNAKRRTDELAKQAGLSSADLRAAA